MTKVFPGGSDEVCRCKKRYKDVATDLTGQKIHRQARHPRRSNLMALGVLNNLSAVYAENNLNNTSNSLQTVLQQLSSGSKINSGADDAAGLSLVNGLEANSTALTQSATNATEGVGLLDVADGALSQVTSLLDRAITLATEASNGTLNTSQEAAANQEYTSILAEVNNIGSTTTYNQEQVFTGNTTSIYTGDSSTAGSSIDDLNIRTLSESSVGDTGGKMTYSSNSNGTSVFINLGSATAATTDYLDAGTPGAVASITVDTLSSSGATVSSTISTGGIYPNTVGGLISAINASGLGLTASLATGDIAGGAAMSANKGIMITGSVGNGSTPSSASFSGSLSAAAATTDNLTGSITIKAGSGAATVLTMGTVNTAMGGTTLADLESYIAADSALGVTGAGGTTLALQSTNPTDALTVTSDLTDSTTGNSLIYTAAAAYNVGIAGTTAFDFTTNQNAADAIVTGSASSSVGTAATSYSDNSGQSLSGTDLLTQNDSQTALTDLNVAITDVAAMDGYIGAQINTLKSVSSVITTQQENVTSAQNAIQATDYAAATSAMSKYEILSQTGIAALAQANTVQQEVTKLLQ
jgi:flagellin